MAMDNRGPAAGRFGGVLFDLDGTLVDTLPDIARAVNLALAHSGWATRTHDELRVLVGEGPKRLVERLLPDAPQFHGEVLAACLANYERALVVDSKAFPGVVALLSDLCSAALPIAVLSNKPHAQTTQVVATLFPHVPFTDVHGHIVGTPMKPEPTSALRLAERMKCSPNRCAFVGDTEIDMRTARAAGMYAIGVRWGFRSERQLLDAGADAIVSSPAQLHHTLFEGRRTLVVDQARA